MRWRTGNVTSAPEDGRAFIEWDEQGWWVFHTDHDGGVAVVSTVPLVFAPPAHAPFDTLEEAQRWVEAHVPPRFTQE